VSAPAPTKAPEQPGVTPPPKPQPGAISGTVSIFDANRNRTGTNAYPIYLFDNGSCSGTSINSTTPGPSGNYSFTGLPAGTYCVNLFYSGSPVEPGNPQVVGVSEGSTTTVNFDIVPPG
jgi:hypothetical protein